jgi:amino acid transporter
MEPSRQRRPSGSAGSAGRLAAGAIGMWGIVFFVVAAAAPMAVVVGGSPLSYRFGGIGAPGAYLVCGLVMVLFAIGFTAMTGYVKNAGAFYTYISRGLGRPAGVGAALLALVAYAAMGLGLYGMLGYFTSSMIVTLAHRHTPWQVWTYLGVVLIGYLGYRHVQIGARLLGVLMSCEVLVLLVLSVAVLVHGGREGISLASFHPRNVFAWSAGAMFIGAMGAFVGFESTAIYAEEARDPERSVPRATYVSVGFLALFYGFTIWIASVAFGAHGLLRVVASPGVSDLYFRATREHLGAAAANVMHVLIVTSIFAALLAFHNAVARYLYCLGREGVLPSRLGRTHPKTRSPYAGSGINTSIAALGVLAFVFFHAHPYLHLLVFTNTTGIVGILSCQVLACVSVVWFFARDRRGHSVLRVVMAPLLAAAGLCVGLALMLTNLDVMTGRSDWVNWLLVLPLPVAVIGGVIVANRIRTKDPVKYGHLAMGELVLEADSD